MKPKLLTRGESRRGFSVLALVAVTLVLAAACGSAAGGRSGFRHSFSSAAGELRLTANAAMLSIERAPSLTSARAESRFQRLAAAWHSSLSRLERLSPPPLVASQFRKLLASATRMEHDLKALVAAADAPNVTAARHAAIRLVIDTLTAKSTSQTIRHRLS